MKSTIKNIVLFLAILLSLIAGFSCKKYLDEKPRDNLSTPSTVKDLQALLDNSSHMNIGRTPAFLEVSADDYFLVQSTYNAASTENQQAYKWSLAQYNFEPGNDWASTYLPIYNANVCLDAIDDIPVESSTVSEWNNAKGSALFYRSFYFLKLAWTFAKSYDETTAASDLGIVLRLTSDPYVPSVRSNVQETYNQIISDAKEAIHYLPNIPAHPMRPSKAAAYALLARTYLSMRQYSSALKYADSSLQIQGAIMDFKTPCSSCDVISTSASTQVPFKRFNSETIFYTEMSTNFSVHRPGNGRVDSTLYLSFASNDLRRTTYFRSQSPYQRFKGSYTGNVITLFTGLATDEMYLIRAECNARAGNKDAALLDLNALLSKRYNATFVQVTAIDANAALDRILIERRKELLMRGIRWADIKRLNKEGKNITQKRIIDGQTYTLAPNDDKYALALPTDIILQTGIAQNPGW